MVREQTERETISRVVAWLRARADQPHVIKARKYLLSPASRWVLRMAADDLESGWWEDDDEHV
jgi:hypothetical protein